MKYAVIVDAYSAGNLLAGEFRERGIECLHVQSTKEIWPILLPSFFPGDFKENFKFDNDMEFLVQLLSKFDLLCILPGTETGVELADALAEKLSVKGNGTKYGLARRNKYLMVDQIAKAGLSTAKQIRAESVEEVLKWKEENDLSEIIIKPINSAGTDNVFICKSEIEVSSACDKIIGQTNKLGLFNNDVLAQEFLKGTEYFINTVSDNGSHYFTDIWQYEKRSLHGHYCVYDNNQLRPFSGSVEDQLREYVLKVLNALEVKYGPSHTEVMMTSEGPKIIEIGTRLDGLSVPSVNNQAIGFGPLDLTVDLFVNKERFNEKTKNPYPLVNHARTVYLTSFKEAEVKSIPGEDKIRSLESFHQMRLRVSPGKKTVKTINYFTAPGFVSLVHKDPDVVKKDFDFIRDLEKSGELFHYV